MVHPSHELTFKSATKVILAIHLVGVRRYITALTRNWQTEPGFSTSGYDTAFKLSSALQQGKKKKENYHCLTELPKTMHHYIHMMIW